MPTVTFPKKELVRLLDNIDRSDDEFSEIFRQYGIELDKVFEEQERFTNDTLVKYSVDISANRSDLLCVEGIAAAIRVYLGLSNPSLFHDVHAVEAKDKKIVIDVNPSAHPLRSYIVSAVVRNITMDQIGYNSLIDHQDKLHHNVCRRRTLVAIGTHDLDKIIKESENEKEYHFSYGCELPADIKFVALGEKEEMDGKELFESNIKNRRPVASYQGLISDAPKWPVLRDHKNRVLSLPPIINAEFSKCEVSTKNIFIECTATDLTKAHIVVNSMINQLRFHSSTPLEVESVKVIYHGSPNNYPMLPTSVSYIKENEEIETITTPEIVPIVKEIDVDEMQKIVGVPSLFIDESKATGKPIDAVAPLLGKMGIITVEKENTNGKILICTAPFTRVDVMHRIDIIEDYAIGYGYDNISKIAEPVKARTIGSTLKVYQISELLREEAAVSGFSECLLFSLCPNKDKIFGEQPVKLLNSTDGNLFARARSTLAPGLLNTVSANQYRPLPMRFFECSEVVDRDRYIDEQPEEYKNETGLKAVNHFAAIYAGTTDGFAYVHGLLDRLLLKLGVTAEIEPEDNEELCLRGRRGAVYILNGTDRVKVGWIGTIHPNILTMYEVPFPVSIFEIDLEQIIRIRGHQAIHQ